MIIYFASIEPHNMDSFILMQKNMYVLLSHYDLNIGVIPFRKETWDIIKNDKEVDNEN